MNWWPYIEQMMCWEFKTLARYFFAFFLYIRDLWYRLSGSRTNCQIFEFSIWFRIGFKTKKNRSKWPMVFLVLNENLLLLFHVVNIQLIHLFSFLWDSAFSLVLILIFKVSREISPTLWKLLKQQRFSDEYIFPKILLHSLWNTLFVW